jgi:hypothetical protein
MYGPGTPPSPPEETPAPASGPGSVRYVYLLSRLRNRQITMEEATELFAIQQAMIRMAQTAPPPPPPASAGGAPAPVAPSPLGVVVSEDAYWIAFLALGAGAGLGSALVKRMTAGPPTGPVARSDPPPKS